MEGRGAVAQLGCGKARGVLAGEGGAREEEEEAGDVHCRQWGIEGEAEAPVAGCCCYSCEEPRGELVGLGMNLEGLWAP